MIWKLLIKSALLYKQWHQYKISACLINHKYALVWGSTWCLSWKGYTSDCFQMQDKLFMSLLPTVAYCYKAQCKVCMIVTIGYFFGRYKLLTHSGSAFNSWMKFLNLILISSRNIYNLLIKDFGICEIIQ